MMSATVQIRIVFVWLVLLLSITEAAYYSYSYIPKKVFVHQVFPVTILSADSTADQKVDFAFDPSSNIKPLTPKPLMVRNGHNTFYTFYFQQNGEDDFGLPALTITDAQGSQQLEAYLIHTQRLDTTGEETFCGLLATDCMLVSSQVSTFDANTTMVMLNFQAHESNPESIHIPGVLEEGIEKNRRENSTSFVEYYFVIPQQTKQITLSYYNTIQHRFVPITIKTDYSNKPVAAQVELNPKASPLDRLKKYGSLALALFFVWMFWWQRDRLYLVLLVVTLLILFVVYRPSDKLCIQEGAPLYILPTRNSRISTNIQSQLHINSLGQHGDYYKIQYKNGIIGWINHENTCQD